jgi:hypothetical protein
MEKKDVPFLNARKSKMEWSNETVMVTANRSLLPMIFAFQNSFPFANIIAISMKITKQFQI